MKINDKKTKNISISKREIGNKIEKFLKNNINKNEEIVIVGVLENSMVLAIDIMHNIKNYFVELDFIFVNKIKNYYEISDLKISNLSKKNVLVVFDEVDNYNILNSIVKKLNKQKPKSISFFSLFKKGNFDISNLKYNYNFLYKINNEKVFGYGIKNENKFQDFNNVYIQMDI